MMRTTGNYTIPSYFQSLDLAVIFSCVDMKRAARHSEHTQVCTLIRSARSCFHLVQASGDAKLVGSKTGCHPSLLTLYLTRRSEPEPGLQGKSAGARTPGTRG